MANTAIEISASDEVGLNHNYLSLDRTTAAGTTNIQISPVEGLLELGWQKKPCRSAGYRGARSPPVMSTSASSAQTAPAMNPLATNFQPKAAVAIDKTQLIKREWLEMRPVKGKGLGLFAVNYIPCGARILSEEPLLKITNHKLHSVWAPYCRLSTAQKAVYDNLHVFAPPHLDLEHTARTSLLNNHSRIREPVESAVADRVRAMSIFACNNFLTSPNGCAVYGIASRLNHSCIPNVHHSYNSKLQSLTVHAVRDILPNEELLTNYLGSEATYQSASKRMAYCLQAYGFICRCPACADQTGASDSRRELMALYKSGLHHFNTKDLVPHSFIPANPAAALKQAEDIVGVMLTEGIVNMDLCKAWRSASSQALAMRDFNLAFQYARSEAAVEKNCLGTTLRDLHKAGVSTECWIEEIYDVMRETHGPAATDAYRQDVKKLQKKANLKLRQEVEKSVSTQ